MAPDEALAVRRAPRRFVGRGGEKLDHALNRFEVAVVGCLVIDAGASTGGFTDCLLQRGASKVVAIDVGHGQLHERLRTDPRVVVRDRTNVRHLTASDLPSGRPADLVVADLSFVSLAVVARALVGLSATHGNLVLLVKPQFEAGRAAATKGRGVISDPAVWRSVVVSVRDAFAAEGAAMVSIVTSPILGAQGNVEFLVHLERGGGVDTETDRDVDVAIDRAMEVASDMRRKTATHLLAERR